MEGLGKGPCARSAARVSTTIAAGALAASWRHPSRVRHAATCRPLRFSEKSYSRKANLGGKRLCGGCGGCGGCGCLRQLPSAVLPSAAWRSLHNLNLWSCLNDQLLQQLFGDTSTSSNLAASLGRSPTKTSRRTSSPRLCRPASSPPSSLQKFQRRGDGLRPGPRHIDCLSCRHHEINRGLPPPLGGSRSTIGNHG